MQQKVAKETKKGFGPLASSKTLHCSWLPVGIFLYNSTWG
jgi:hypothetical protein